MFGPNITEDSHERKVAKQANFLILYGGGFRTLSMRAEISETQTKKSVNRFFEKLNRLRNWINEEKKQGRKLKYAETIFHRIRPLQDMYGRAGDDENAMGHADRAAVNFKIQGACADIMKVVMARVYTWIHNNNLENEIKMLITVHDEIVYEILESKLEQHVAALNQIMCISDIIEKNQWPVRLNIDAEYGDSWHADHNLFKERPGT